jgi:hypothetical protein
MFAGLLSVGGWVVPASLFAQQSATVGVSATVVRPDEGVTAQIEAARAAPRAFRRHAVLQSSPADSPALITAVVVPDPSAVPATHGAAAPTHLVVRLDYPAN